MACNVANPSGTESTRRTNDLPSLLREWFGPDAGVPGTGLEVEFSGDGDSCHVAPVAPGGAARMPSGAGSGTTSVTTSSLGKCAKLPLLLVESPLAAARYATHVPVFALTAAAGFWGPESTPEELGWTEVRGVTMKPGMFVAKVTGQSMEPLIPAGSSSCSSPPTAPAKEVAGSP